MIERILSSSMDKSRVVTIIYQKGEEITKRNIRVIALQGNKVKAFCYLRNQLRVFLLENILSASFAYPVKKIIA